jgi:hypothetical protein
MDSMVVFWGTFILLSMAFALICIPTNSVDLLLFLHILTNICCLCFHDSHFDWGEVGSQCHFDLYFLYGQGCWLFLHTLWAICTFLNCLFSSFAHLFSGFLIPWEVSFLSSLNILFMNLLSSINLESIFSHSVDYLFSLTNIFFALQKFLTFHIVPFVNPFF